MGSEEQLEWKRRQIMLLIPRIIHFTRMCAHPRAFTSTWAAPAAVHGYLKHKLPEKAPYLLICSRQNKVEPGYAQVVWLNQLLKLTASSQTVYLTLPPTSPAVPQCCAICACSVCSFPSSSHMFRLYPKAWISWPSPRAAHRDRIKVCQPRTQNTISAMNRFLQAIPYS